MGVRGKGRRLSLFPSSSYRLALLFPFKLQWWQVVQSRMQTLLIVNLFHKPSDMFLRFLQTVILFSVYFFLLQRFHEALGISIIVGVSATAHADFYLLRPQAFGIGLRRILHSAIGMVHQSWLHLPLLQGLLQSTQRQFGS